MTQIQKDVTLSVLVSYCCCNKLAQVWLLKTTHIYYLIALEVKSSKWVSRGWNQGVSRVGFLLEALGKKLFSGLFQHPEAVCMPWLMAPSSIFKSQQQSILKPLSASAFSASLFLLKGLSWLHCIHPDNAGSSPHREVSWLANLLPSAASLPPCNVTASPQVPGVRVRTASGGCYSPHTTRNATSCELRLTKP